MDGDGAVRVAGVLAGRRLEPRREWWTASEEGPLPPTILVALEPETRIAGRRSPTARCDSCLVSNNAYAARWWLDGCHGLAASWSESGKLRDLFMRGSTFVASHGCLPGLLPVGYQGSVLWSDSLAAGPSRTCVESDAEHFVKRPLSESPTRACASGLCRSFDTRHTEPRE